MTDDSPAVARARRRAEEARQRLLGSFDDIIAYGREMQEKLAPSHLARDAWQAAKDKSVDLAEDAVDAVRKRPIAASGAVAAVALYIAREPVMELASKMLGSKKKSGAKRKTNKKSETTDG